MTEIFLFFFLKARATILGYIQVHHLCVHDLCNNLYYISAGELSAGMAYNWFKLPFRKIQIDIFSFKQSLFSTDRTFIVRATFSLVSIIFWIFFVFNMGDTITRRFERVSNSVYSCRSVDFPPKSRKYVNTMLVVAQKPIYIQGFGNVRCTRETFKSVWLKYTLFKLTLPITTRNSSTYIFFLNSNQWLFQVMKAAFMCSVVANHSMETKLQIFQLYRSFKTGDIHF